MHYYYISYQYNSRSSQGFGCCSISRTKEISNANHVFDLAKQIAKENNMGTVVIISFIKMEAS